MRRWRLASLLILAACAAPRETSPEPNAAGLVPLSCDGRAAVYPVNSAYCVGQRHYVTPSARQSLEAAAAKLAAAYPGARVGYMEASWPIGKKPMPPHLSHGDGRQIDLALFYETPKGVLLRKPPRLSGYGAFEPPRREADRIACKKGQPHERPDPPKSRSWRMDEERTRVLLRALVDDPKVRRIFIEPHLKTRLGFSGSSKVRFAGCQAARHDDHIHVDFY